METIIVTILIYSLILTLATIYQDNSSYYTVETLDIIIAGPVCWALLIFVLVARCIYKKLPIDIRHKIENKPKKKKSYSENKIRKIVSKVIKRDKKYRNKIHDDGYYVTLDRKSDIHNSYIYGWGFFIKRDEFSESLNKKFEYVMYDQEYGNIAKAVFREVFRSVTAKELVQNRVAYNLYEANNILKYNDVIFVSYQLDQNKQKEIKWQI